MASTSPSKKAESGAGAKAGQLCLGTSTGRASRVPTQVAGQRRVSAGELQGTTCH